MKYIYILIAATLITILTFCTGGKETQTETKLNNNISKRLTEAAMFNNDSIKYALATTSIAQKDESRRCFLKAMDLLVNKQKAKESIAYFKDAILYSPDVRMYYFLTKAYIETGDAENATKSNEVCYNMGDIGGYDPYYEVVFNDALINAIKGDSAACISSLNDAIYEGFLNKARIVNEKRFDFIRENPHYISMIVNTFNDDAKLKALLFKGYINSFPDLALPYTESIDSVKNHNYNYINYDYAAFIPNMEDGRFSRDVTNEYFCVGKIKLENHYYAMVYKTYLAIADTLNPVKTFVITYDSLGATVDEEMIGCFCTPTLSQAYTINKDFVIETTAYNYKWKNEPLEKGYAGNQIISTEPDKPKQIQLIEKGEIKREKVAGTDTSPAKSGG